MTPTISGHSGSSTVEKNSFSYKEAHFISKKLQTPGSPSSLRGAKSTSFILYMCSLVFPSGYIWIISNPPPHKGSSNTIQPSLSLLFGGLSILNILMVLPIEFPIELRLFTILGTHLEMSFSCVSNALLKCGAQNHTQRCRITITYSAIPEQSGTGPSLALKTLFLQCSLRWQSPCWP